MTWLEERLETGERSILDGAIGTELERQLVERAPGSLRSGAVHARFLWRLAEHGGVGGNDAETASTALLLTIS